VDSASTPPVAAGTGVDRSTWTSGRGRLFDVSRFGAIRDDAYRIIGGADVEVTLRHGAAVIRPREHVGHLAPTAGGIVLTLLAALVLLSAFLSPAINWTVRATLAGFCVLAIVRPADALLITFALVGFGIILSHLGGVPTLRVTEVLVVASLAACGVGALLPRGTAFRRALTGAASVPIVLFAIAAVVSTLVWLRVYQFETGDSPAYIHALAQFVIRDYFVQPGDFWVVVSTAAIVEGLALYVVVAAVCQVDATFFARALRMLMLGGAGLALMSIVRLAEIFLRNPQALAVLRASNAGLRISPQIPDYIAAGSYFALCWLIALGLAVAARRGRVLWVAAGVPLLAALYLTGSRSVIAAALGGVVILVISVARRLVPVRGVIAFAAIALIVMAVSFRWIIGHDVAGATAKQSMTVRVELIRAGLRVMATRPLFGVGIDRFFLVAGNFASPELNALWPGRKNPHNDFLRFGGELGLVGLGLFAWILAAAGRRIWKGLRETRDGRLAGLVGGLAAFLITSLASNPLMVRDVSYVFWIALGLAVGRSANVHDVAGQAMTAAGGLSTRVSRWRPAIAVLLGAVLLASVPFRVRQELASVNPNAVSSGLFDWGIEPDGTRCRLSGPQVTLYVNGGARLVEIPLKGTLPSGAVQQVEIRVDGRSANRVAVGAEWQRLRTLLPADAAPSPHRIDLLIVPSWVPAEVISGSQDRRALGVKVGEIKVLTAAGRIH
jgi:O-antigen ligase